MTAITKWTPPPPEPSYFATVKQVLALVRGSGAGVSRATPAGQIAADTLPRRLPHTQAFMAWALYYETPDARRVTLEALNRE